MTEQHDTPHEHPARLALRAWTHGGRNDVGATPPRAREEVAGCPATDGPGQRPAERPPQERTHEGGKDRPVNLPIERPPERPAEHPAQSRERDRLRYLDAAARRIGRGLELDETLQGLCRACVPVFADATMIYLREPLPVGEHKVVGPVVLHLRHSDQIGYGHQGKRYRFKPSADFPAAPGFPVEAEPVEPVRLASRGVLTEILREGRPVFTDDARGTGALRELLGSALAATLPQGARVILAPLRGRRSVLGTVVLLRGAERPPFESDDLLVAAQLATHTALGVDKALLYGREAYIADALQRAMLPTSLPQPTGVRLAHRYLPAAQTARVGGDWYDSIPLPGNRVALVVGDVMGHSMTSAAIMGQLRTTVQTLAMLDLPPEEVLYHLDEQAQRLGDDRMATCLYAVYDPIAHRLVLANAGHVPPLLLHRDGRAEVLRLPTGAPIGVGGISFESVELPAPAGATLLLYTDGLVESRVRDVGAGVEQLRERLAAAGQAISSPPLEPLCDEALDVLGPGDRDDDVALLAARFDGIPPQNVAYWFLEPHPQTPGRARRLVRRALRRWNLPELIDTTELLVSEVVTNAVRYADRPVTLRLLCTDNLRCEVGDDCPQLPRRRQAQPCDEDGRGLAVVSRLAKRWGATRLSTGKVVWFEQSLPSKD
ncbi:SpoIIE family protein phosphatase [Wenjunlia vitaminophila]|uniref:SpoIIE family protein phosphatase n=1 Tax=Wenjunlia vitaminophila TaxID=76728 RepID=UPI0003A9E440|nr:SpoIIE family protein phosphatase [Wenjunlia vitaminophila]